MTMTYKEVFTEIADCPHEPDKLELRLSKLMHSGNMTHQSAMIVEEAYRAVTRQVLALVGEAIDNLAEPLRYEAVRYIPTGVLSALEQILELTQPEQSISSVILALLMDELKDAPTPMMDGPTPGCDCPACTIARQAGVKDRTIQ